MVSADFPNNQKRLKANNIKFMSYNLSNFQLIPQSQNRRANLLFSVFFLMLNLDF